MAKIGLKKMKKTLDNFDFSSNKNDKKGPNSYNNFMFVFADFFTITLCLLTTQVKITLYCCL